MERKPGRVTIERDGSRSLRLLVLPVLGRARDVFRSTAALAVALDITRPSQVDERSLDLLVFATGLTRRETEVTRLVASGCTPRQSADLLAIRYETRRLYLTTAAASSCPCQAELTALVDCLSLR